jgi:hypothetical protein
MTTALEGVSVQRHAPATPPPLPGKTRYQLYRRLGGPQDRSGLVWKISPPPGFDTRTVQPVASRYTYYATRHTEDGMERYIFLICVALRPNADDDLHILEVSRSQMKTHHSW